MYWLYIYVSFKEKIIKTEHNKEIVDKKIIIQNKICKYCIQFRLKLNKTKPYHSKFDDILEATQQ